jgi:hypothetical protein
MAAMEVIRVCISNLWALQERRYAVVYVAVTKFVRTMMRLILFATPRYFWYVIPTLPILLFLVLPLPPILAHLLMAHKIAS